MKKIFKCSCRTHIIEIEYDTWSKFKIPDLWIGIYDIYNSKTGRKYKKPKLIGDVQLIGSQPYDKEMNNLMHFLENIVMQYIIRRK